MENSNQNTCGCQKKTKLVFACSGASDLGELTDKAARVLTQEKAGNMFCLAGIGAHIEDMVEKTRSADMILAIDGCQKDCVKLTLQQAGITEIKQLRLTDLGYQKGNSPLSNERIGDVVQEAKQILCQ